MLCRAPKKHPDICGMFKHISREEKSALLMLAGSRLCPEKHLATLRKDVLDKRALLDLDEKQDYALLKRDRYVAPSMAHSLTAGYSSTYKRKFFTLARRWRGMMSYKREKQAVELWAWMASHELLDVFAKYFRIDMTVETVTGFWTQDRTSFIGIGCAYDLVPILIVQECDVLEIDTKPLVIAVDNTVKVTHDLQKLHIE